MEGDLSDLWVRVSEHRERLLRLARSRTPTAEDAEDCVHEAMLRCVEFENLDHDRLGALLTTVTIRVCADRYRARQYGERLRHRLAAHPTVAAGPEEDVCDRAEAAWLAAKVDQLPERQQAVVRARAEGLSCAEVASTFRMSYEAVESQIARARKTIRSARLTSLGLLLPRWRLVAAGGASVGAAVLMTVAPFQQPADSGRPRVVALPPAPGAATPDDLPDHAPAVTSRAAAAPARAVVAAPDPAAGPLLPLAKKKDPRDDAEKIVDGPVPVGWEEGDKEYSTAEQVLHCVQYGVEVTEHRIGCRYPPD